MAGWWEGEAPQENKKKVGLIAAGGTGTAAAIGAGAYLLSRGKAKPKGIKFAPVQPKVKAPKNPRPAPQPKPPAPINVTRISLQPKAKPKVKVNTESMERGQRVLRAKKVQAERKEANEIAPQKWQDDPNLKGIPENATPEEVDRLLDATGPVPQKVGKNPSKARQARRERRVQLGG